MIEELWNSEEVIKLRENYKKYLVLENMAEKGIDRDRCSYVWNKLYIPLYSGRYFWRDTDFPCCEENDEKDKYEISYSNLKTKISGDVLFNFKNGLEKKQRQKYEHYLDLIDKEKDFSEIEKHKYCEVLHFCKEMTHTLHNFGLMPVDGNLQVFKETSCNRDRLDRFVYYVNEYLVNNEFFRLTSNYRYKDQREKAKADQKIILAPFFDKFNKSIFKYCQEMYLINDSTYVRKLILFGEKEIKDGKDVVIYMELAIEYWVMKNKLFNQMHLLDDGGGSN